MVRVMRDGVKLAEPFLDISGEVADRGEQGLLLDRLRERGAAALLRVLHRVVGVQRHRRLPDVRSTSTGCRRRDPARVRPGSRRRVISIPHPRCRQPQRRHGRLRPGRQALAGARRRWRRRRPVPERQNLDSLLGKLLRIDPVRGAGPAVRATDVPRSNPFVGIDGRDEIWSYGLRNPFRFSFDNRLRTVAIGDVGQGTQEEVSIVTLGGARGAASAGRSSRGRSTTASLRPYSPPRHRCFRCSRTRTGSPAAVTGGVIARDPDLPQLAGRYLVADFYAGQVGSFVPDLPNNEADDASEPRHRANAQRRSIRCGTGRPALRGFAERRPVQTGGRAGMKWLERVHHRYSLASAAVLATVVGVLLLVLGTADDAAGLGTPVGDENRRRRLRHRRRRLLRSRR